MVKKNIILLDIDYITFEEKPVIRLFGKIKKDNSKNLIALDDSFIPYLYILPKNNIEKCMKDIKNLKEDKIIDYIEIKKVLKKNFQVPTEFIKMTFNHPQNIPKYKDKIWDLNSVKQLREHDIPFYRRYLIDNALVPMAELELEGKLIESFKTINTDNENLEILKLTKPPKTANTDFQQFRMMSFDLEVRNPQGMPNPEEDEIIMIGIDSNVGIRKVISTKGDEFKHDPEMYFIEKVDSEKEMIKSFIKTVKENNIDIIIGYNSDVFDLPYLKDRAKLWNINLNLGFDGSDIKFIKRGYNNAATFKGLLHVDLYLVMRRYMSLDRYTLERVYFEFFGEEKIDIPGEKIYEYWDNEGEKLKKLFKYSLDDVVSTLKIAQEILPINLELTRIICQPFVDGTRMTTGTQAEWYLIRKAYEANEVIPNKPNITMKNIRERGSNSGGYVKEPEIGLHENLVQFDFKSLYPTLIISKNISPDVLIKENISHNSKFEDFEKDYEYTNNHKKNELPNKINNNEEYYISPEHFFKFKKEPKGFIPLALEDILNKRFEIKKHMKTTNDPILKKSLDVQQQALKRLANTMYGVYGFLRFRWYSFECAQAITAWGRQHIKKAMKEAENYGFKAIYADTDGFYAKYMPEIKKEN